MKAGDLIYDETSSPPKYAIVIDSSEQFPHPESINRVSWPGTVYYFYYTCGAVHEIWWNTYTDERKAKIKVLNSMENEE